MPPPGIVDALDVIEHVGLAWARVRYVLAAVRSVFSEEKTRSIAAWSQTLPARLMLQVTPWSTRSRWKDYWLPPIGVMQYGFGLPQPPDRHHERIGDELRGHRRAHGPANDPSREEIDDRAGVELAFGGSEVSEVRDPFSVRWRGGERPVEQIRRHRVR